jgi:PAS domain S-box-containing protein
MNGICAKEAQPAKVIMERETTPFVELSYIFNPPKAMPKLLRVLFIEDSEDDAFFTVQELARNGFEPEFERVETLAALSTALDRQVWDVILADHSLPGFTSFQALDLIRRRQCDTPFIIVSGVIGEETAVKAMKAGANDYVMKSSLQRLVPSIERELVEASNRRIRAQAEKALRRSQHDLNDFFENAPLSLHWAAPDGTVLRVNASVLKTLNCAQADIVGHSINEFFVEKRDADEVLRRLRQGEEIQEFETRLRRKDGAVRDVVINANGLWEDGKFVRSRWFTTDVTDRKEYRKAIAFLGAVVESSEDAVIGTDNQGKIVSWNSGAVHMYGYAPDEAVGKSIDMLSLPSRPEETPASFRQVLDSAHGKRYETFHLRKDGQTLPVSVARSPIKDPQGKVIGVSTIERDITQRKQEELEKLFLIQELSKSLASVKTLRGLLPICASCKKIRDDHGYWQQIEAFLVEHSEAEFTHGICPDCKAQMESDLEPQLAD